MREYLLEHMRRYPQMQVTDGVKLLYQSEFGGGHMIAGPARSLKWIEEEWKNMVRAENEADAVDAGGLGKNESVAADGQETPVEPIGNGMCRVYLSALDEGLCPETLNQMFVQTADRTVGNIADFEKKLEVLSECCRRGETPFSAEELDTYLKEYKAQGYPPVSHSERYRQLYHPAYRVAAEYYTRFYQVFLKIDQVRKAAGDRTVVVAIDGKCGSGKSTLGRILKEIYGCSLFHMDDFFLRPEQRTGERLAQPGGNVDYERFKTEILDHIADKDGVEYQRYDCSMGCLAEKVRVPYCQLNIVEGAYSQHPYFGDRYDLCFFYGIDEEEQVRRIMKRNGPEMLKRFQKEWIPMEEKYFSAFEIAKKSWMI